MGPLVHARVWQCYKPRPKCCYTEYTGCAITTRIPVNFGAAYSVSEVPGEVGRQVHDVTL